MDDLASLLRRLAEVVDANGGQVPDVLSTAPKPDLLSTVTKGKVSIKDQARSRTLEHLYGIDNS